MRTLSGQFGTYSANFLKPLKITFCPFKYHIIPLKDLKVNKITKTYHKNV